MHRRNKPSLPPDKRRTRRLDENDSGFQSKKKLPDGNAYRAKCLNGLLEYDISDIEAACILSFTGANSSWINSPLREDRPLDTDCKRFYADTLEKALDKLPSYNKQYVFRMDNPLGSKEEVTKWYKSNIGNIINVPNFLSTSIENFENSEITWHIKTLPKESLAKNLLKLTNNLPEKEVLFKRNSFFSIKSVNKKKGLIEMTEVTPCSNAIRLVKNYYDK